MQAQGQFSDYFHEAKVKLDLLPMKQWKSFTDVTGMSPVTEFDLCFKKCYNENDLKKKILQQLDMFFFLTVSVCRKMHTSLVAGELFMGVN